MKKINQLAVTLALLGCGVAASAGAQTSSMSSSWYLAPSVNIMRADNDLNSDRNGFGVGLRVGKAVMPMVDVQFGASYSQTGTDGTRYKQSMLGVDGLYMFSREQMRPFVLLGVGAQYDELDRAGDPSRTSPYINLGVGVQYDLTPRLALQADVRHVHGFVHDSNVLGTSSLKNNYLTVGVNYAFGR